MGDQTNKKTGIGCAILFALPFAAIGCFMAWRVATTLVEWQQAKQWVETPAEILEVELECHQGDDSDTFEATARYAYEYAGQKYEGDRVSLHSGSDNIGSFHQDVDAELRAHKADNKPFPCYVNPNQPDEAVLYRDLRIGMIAFESVFVLLFGGFGFGLLSWMWYSYGQETERERRGEQYPQEPWRHREDWVAGIIRNDHHSAQVAMWAFALFWNLISWTVAVAMYTSDDKMPVWVYGIGIGFPIIGLGMLGYAVYLTLRHWRWGTSELELASVPGVIGGRLAGVIRLSRDPRPQDGFLVSLTYYKQRREKSSDGDSTYEDPVWQAEKRITRTLDDSSGQNVAIPVNFSIPYDQSPSDAGVLCPTHGTFR